MSFNVFDEAPENRLVIKEQQMSAANKVRRALYEKANSSRPLHISYDHIHFLEETMVFMALKEDFGLMAYSMYTHAKTLLCRSSDIVGNHCLKQRQVAFNQHIHCMK